MHDGYEAFYGLTENPFNITPDPKFLYLSESHEEALAHLLYGVQRKKGLVVLTGEIGTGKTTLLHTLIERLDARTHVAFLANPHISILDIYQFAFHEFGLETKERTKGEYLIALKTFLIRCARAQENVVLIVDEAQHFSPEVLEELRLLTNFETVKEKLLQIILVGQPALEATLALPELVQLKQRVGISYRLLPLNYLETKGYIESRLTIAGVKDSPFGSEAIHAIHAYSKGVPRLINTLCDLALFLGFAERQMVIERPMIRQAAEHLGLYEPEKRVDLPTGEREAADRADASVIKQAQSTLIRDSLQFPESHRGWLSAQNRNSKLGFGVAWPSRLEHSQPLQPEPARRGFRRSRFVIIAIVIVVALVVGWIVAQKSEGTPAALAKISRSLEHLFPARQSPVQETASPLAEGRREAQPSAEKSLPTETVPTRQTPTPVTAADDAARRGQEIVTYIVNRYRASQALETPSSSSIAQQHHIPRVVVIQAGDYLSKILFETYGYYDETLLSLVQEANPGLIDPAYIEVGQSIVLPPLPAEKRTTSDTRRQQKQ